MNSSVHILFVEDSKIAVVFPLDNSCEKWVVNDFQDNWCWEIYVG